MATSSGCTTSSSGSSGSSTGTCPEPGCDTRCSKHNGAYGCCLFKGKTCDKNGNHKSGDESCKNTETTKTDDKGVVDSVCKGLLYKVFQVTPRNPKCLGEALACALACRPCHPLPVDEILQITWESADPYAWRQVIMPVVIMVFVSGLLLIIASNIVSELLRYTFFAKFVILMIDYYYSYYARFEELVREVCGSSVDLVFFVGQWFLNIHEYPAMLRGGVPLNR
ncbi:DNA topoisomerase III, putative [Babesia ovis]|uniref:DNA topoisomerase III, putative n=1 Tax=Babesia ovis TaxID=5869 RepID=A0A9W5WUF4_BABOV|nr:DNA topoisomerase III, putative [Babesia ovis]